MEKVKIEVRSNKLNEEPLEVVYLGKREEREGRTLITYEESVLTGMEGVFTELSINHDRLEITRTGNIESKMVFKEHHKDVFVYKMDVGAMSMALETDRLSVGKEKGGIDIYILYRLEIGGNEPDRNEMFIKITKG